MRDEIFDRGYQDGRNELHAGLGRFFTRVANGAITAFETMHRIEWSAPWDRNSKKDCAGLA